MRAALDPDSAKSPRPTPNFFSWLLIPAGLLPAPSTKLTFFFVFRSNHVVLRAQTRQLLGVLLFERRQQRGAEVPLMIELVRGSLRPATGNHILNVPQR
jgi:hypothetical protein